MITLLKLIQLKKLNRMYLYVPFCTFSDFLCTFFVPFRVTLTEVESGSVKGSEDWEVTGEPIELFELEEAEQEIASMADSKKTVQCVGLFLVILIGFCIGMMASSFHIIDEGNVGVYYKQGKTFCTLWYPFTSFLIFRSPGQ